MTPAPFPNDRLPYTPLHIPGDVAGVNAPRGASTVAPGPASTAASAIIPPTPGGVAGPSSLSSSVSLVPPADVCTGPHNAIPALPDAGYTAPSLRPAPLAQGSRASSVAAYGQHLGANGARPIQAAYPGVPVSGYGGGSMYGGASMYNPPGATIAALQNTNSLPSPRRSHPPQALDPNVPKEDAHHHHHHHQHHIHSHQHQHQPHHHRHHELNDADKQSDASYYSRPKVSRHQSESSDSQSDVSSPREYRHKRSPSSGTEYQGRRLSSLPPEARSHAHPPISPSPLARGPPPPAVSGGLRSPRPSIGMSQATRHRYHSQSYGERGKRQTSPAPNEDDGRPKRNNGEGLERRGSHQASHRHDEHKRLPQSHKDDHRQKHSRPTHATHQASSEMDHTQLPELLHHHKLSDARPDALDSESENDYTSAPEREHHHHSHHHHQHHDKHHRTRSYTQLHAHAPHQLPIPLDSATQAQLQRPRRRARSMQMEQPPPLYAGTAPSEVYDDGASIAESAMTFMDGPVQGRTSQYGLPKYPHTPKMDYRR